MTTGDKTFASRKLSTTMFMENFVIQPKLIDVEWSSSIQFTVVHWRHVTS